MASKKGWRKASFEIGESSRGRKVELGQKDLGSCARICAWERVGKRGVNQKQISWADEVGGELLQPSCSNKGEETTFPASGKGTVQEQKVEETTFPASGKGTFQERKVAFNAGHQRSKSPGRTRCEGKSRGEGGSELLRARSCHDDEEAMLAASGKVPSQDQKVVLNAGHQRSNLRVSSGGPRRGGESWGEGGTTYFTTTHSGSYKDALLRRSSPQTNPLNLPHLHPRHHANLAYSNRATHTRRAVKRCFRCLATDHSVAACRDPVRCRRCWKTGHRAHRCKENPGTYTSKMHRAANLRGRAAQSKVFVPYTEEYLRRVELRRNAILADVIQPANLGPEPTITIKNALATRFGGIPMTSR
uniref:CCHC-type domain-containing protein n=1 Tax=Ananas comosus var. bracteatus TaxID=296719 RepID=A0A6V7PQA8_ANACO|nr:unnamed protein product [Ananas comosus var. bracteatus]